MKNMDNMSNKTQIETDMFEAALKIQGAKKAHRGVIFEVPGGGRLHLLGLSKNDYSLPQEAQFYLPFCTPKEVQRVLSIKDARDYLLKKQADAISDNPREYRKILEKKDGWQKKGRSWSLTSYYSSLNGDGRSYISNLSKNRRRAFSNLIFGRAPLPQPNGICLRSLVGDVVIVSDSLHYFFYFTALANLGQFYGLSVEQRAHAFLISLRIMAGVEALDFDLDPREDLPKSVKAEVLQDVGWMMQFTFAHEFSHYSLGHLDAVAPESGDEVSFAHSLEYEADAHAICGNGVNAYRAGKLAWAAQQVFLSFYTLQVASSFRSDFPDFSISRTHPSPTDRLQAVQNLNLKKQPVSQDVLEESIYGTKKFSDSVMEWTMTNKNVFLSYGSVYIPGFDVGRKLDRIEF